MTAFTRGAVSSITKEVAWGSGVYGARQCRIGPNAGKEQWLIGCGEHRKALPQIIKFDMIE